MAVVIGDFYVTVPWTWNGIVPARVPRTLCCRCSGQVTKPWLFSSRDVNEGAMRALRHDCFNLQVALDMDSVQLRQKAATHPWRSSERRQQRVVGPRRSCHDAVGVGAEGPSETPTQAQAVFSMTLSRRSSRPRSTKSARRRRVL